MKRLSLLLLCIPILATPVSGAVALTFSASLQPKVVAVEEGLEQLEDPINTADRAGGYEPEFPDDIDGGVHHTVIRDDLVAAGANGAATFNLGETVDKGFYLDYSITINNLDYDGTQTADTGDDVVAVIINVATRLNGVEGRTGLPLFGIIGPELATGDRYDFNGDPRVAVQPVFVDADTFTLTGVWNWLDWFPPEGGSPLTYAFDLDDWVDELQEGLLYLEVYTNDYPYWSEGEPNPTGTIEQKVWRGGALRGTITAAPTADVLSLLGIGMLGWSVSRRSRKLV